MQEVGATPEGEQYLLARALLQSSAALNLATYLLLKSDYAEEASAKKNQQKKSFMGSDESIMSRHPVLDHLQKLDRLAESMENSVNNPQSSSSLNEQITHLVKASALLENGALLDDQEDDQDSSSSEGQNDDDDEEDGDHDMDRKEEALRDGKVIQSDENDSEDDTDSSTSDHSVDEKVKESQRETNMMNEARFALRLDEIGVQNGKEEDEETGAERKRRRRRAAPEFGEDTDPAMAGGISSTTNVANRAQSASRSLATTVNALEQRFATSSRKRNKHTSDMADQLDDVDRGEGDKENEIRRGLELMEAELGKLESDNDEDNQAGSDDDKDDEQDLDDDDADLAFYNKIANSSSEKKKQRRDRYAVAPKFPRPDATVEDGGERAVSRTIMKNRGLVAHKNKLNRNPRVKKREQYRRALIRRKGAVRAIRDPREGHIYGGEETGIKSGLKRSRNLT